MRRFTLFAALSGFCIAAEYGITRPTSNALFLTTFSSQSYPFVWLATVPLNLLIIYLYNALLPRIGPQRLLCAIAALAIAINCTFAFSLHSFPQLIFFHYAWKDIYILLMFKQLWSMIHGTIPAHRAKYLYGLIFATGTIGAIAGSSIPGFLATHFGSESLLLCTLPIYLLLMLSFSAAYRLSPILAAEPTSHEAGFSLIRKNRYLIAVLLLVVLMQISVGLMEYRFNAHLELNIADKDLRTAFCGKLTGLTNLLSLALQAVGSFLLVHCLGLKRSHFLIPLLLLASALVSWSSFTLLSFSFLLIKSVDYSLFGIIREMLYIPLHIEEKYRAKAIIDVFAYRTSKALVSLVILLLQTFLGAALLPTLNVASIAIFLLWIGVVAFLLKEQPARNLVLE